MKHRRYEHQTIRFNHLKYDPVGESGRIPPANVFDGVPAGIQQWIVRKRVPHANNLVNEFSAQPRLTVLIPCRGPGDIFLHFREQFDLPDHLGNRSSNRAFISSSGTADEGSRRQAARRLSTSSTSSAGRPGSSSPSASRISNWRSDTLNPGSSRKTWAILIAHTLSQTPKNASRFLGANRVCESDESTQSPSLLPKNLEPRKPRTKNRNLWLRRQPEMPFARNIFASSNSVAWFPRERIRDITSDRLDFVKTSSIGRRTCDGNNRLRPPPARGRG